MRWTAARGPAQNISYPGVNVLRSQNHLYSQRENQQRQLTKECKAKQRSGARDPNKLRKED